MFECLGLTAASALISSFGRDKQDDPNLGLWHRTLQVLAPVRPAPASHITESNSVLWCP